MNPFTKLRQSSYGKIIENTVMLAVLQLSNIALSLVTSGYQARVFSEEGMKILAYTNIYMPFFQLFIDFGFAISAVGKIAKHRDEPEYVNKVFTCVLEAKTAFILISALAIPIVLPNEFGMGLETLTYWLSMASIASFALLPDFVYRGFENMSAITIRSVTIKVFATILIFVFAKGENDFYMVPLFTVLGNTGAIFVVYHHLHKKMKVHFVKVTVRDVLLEIKESSYFFASRIASTIYGRVNGIIIKQLTGGMDVVYYERASMVTDAARNGLVAPISESIYPHTMKNRNFGVIKKALMLTMPIMLLGCGLVFVLAEPICVLWLGEKVGPGVVMPLRALLPVVVISLPNYILGFPTMSPMGLAKQANNSITFGTIIHLVNLAVLYFTGHMNLLTLCILTSVAELIILIYRIIIIYKNRYLMHEV